MVISALSLFYTFIFDVVVEFSLVKFVILFCLVVVLVVGLRCALSKSKIKIT